MNPYKIDINKLKVTKTITDEKALLKLRLTAGMLKTIEKMETSEVLERTGLDKSDLSRLRSFNIERFSIDRILGILHDLGFSAQIKIVPLDKAS